MGDSHTQIFLRQAVEICGRLDVDAIDQLAARIAQVRDNGGRLFVLGVGGSAGNAGHAVNDFRKLCDIEAYAPTDNVSELTARANDEGWETVFAGWLRASRANERDAILILSVGGGNAEHNVSMNLVRAIDEAKQRRLGIFGIVGRDGGYTAQQADIAIIVPTADPKHVTPHAEAFQAIVWHCLVSHPALQKARTKW